VPTPSGVWHPGPPPAPNTPNPALSSASALVTITPAKQQVIAAANYTQTISVTNQGPSDDRGVVLTVTAPQISGHPLTFVNTPSDGYSCAPNPPGTQVTCSIAGTGPVGATASVPVSWAVPVVVPLGTTLTTSVIESQATSRPSQDNVAAQATAVVSPKPLSLSMSGPQLFSPGDTLQYAITLTNTWTQPVGGISIGDTIPAGTTFVKAAPEANANPDAFSCAMQPSGTLVCTAANGGIAAGSTDTVDVWITVPANYNKNSVVNSGSASSNVPVEAVSANSGAGRRNPIGDGAAAQGS
jgi:uncharacterized repeat protein (TIGR01451 family)